MSTTLKSFVSRIGPKMRIVIAVVLALVVGYIAYSLYLQKSYALTPAQHFVLKQGGTEVPFSSPLNKENRPGTYYSADCNEPLFRSEQKFDSGTGWPSFWAPIEGSVKLQDDNLLGQLRTEVTGAKCGGHIGHVFADGPEPTGLRYCLNGVALVFVPDDPSAPKPEFAIDMRTQDTLQVRE